MRKKLGDDFAAARRGMDEIGDKPASPRPLPYVPSKPEPMKEHVPETHKVHVGDTVEMPNGDCVEIKEPTDGQE